VLRVGYVSNPADGDNNNNNNGHNNGHLEVLLIVAQSDLPFDQRAAVWEADTPPVPGKLNVYTLNEWSRLSHQVQWVFEREQALR